MLPFEDIIQEEREELHKELITMLRQAYHQSPASTSGAQEQSIQRVGERLAMLKDQEDLYEETFPGRLQAIEAGGRAHRSKRAMHLLNALAAVLVIGLLIGGSLALFTSRQHATTTTIEGKATAGGEATPSIGHVEISGLEMSMIVTRGPYFLSELVLVKMSITNHSHTTYQLAGSQLAFGICDPALILSQTGGESPHYTLPLNKVTFNCPGIPADGTSFKPGQTVAILQYEPLTSSGHVLLTIKAKFLEVEGDIIKQAASPLDGHWPSVQLQVASHIPPERVLPIHQQGSQITVDAPANVYPLAQTVETCGGMNAGSATWEPITWQSPSKAVLSLSTNPDGCAANDIHWQYAITAAGYAIITGMYPD